MKYPNLYLLYANKPIGYGIFIVFFLSLCFGVKAQKMSYALQDVRSDNPFHDGLAVFYNDGYYGAINTNGQVVIKAQFKHLGDFVNGTAIAKTETGEGIINRNGTFILEPKYNISNYNLEHPDVYVISYKENNGKKGLFYNGRLVLPIECSSIMDNTFPFVQYFINGEKKVINIRNGEIFDDLSTVGNIICCKNDISHYPFQNNFYFTKGGETIDKERNTISNKGVVPYQDEETKLYGFKNATSKQILIKPQYSSLLYEIWIEGYMMALKGGSYDLITSEGKVLLSGAGAYLIQGNYIVSWRDIEEDWSLYDKKGKEIIKGKWIFNLGHRDWFSFDSNGKKQIYDVRHKKLYSVNGSHFQNGVIEYDVDEGKYYINAETGLQIAGPLKYGHGFNEGLAVVTKKGQEYQEIIDRNGKVMFKENEKLKFGSEFSEGVISITENGIYSYIYNPLGHNGYNYNQTSFSNQTLERWYELAQDAFAKKQFSTAKDYYYRVMINDPTDVNAVIGYGAALGNMGYYDEAIESCHIALDIDPDNELAKKNLQINLDNKRKDEERQQQDAAELEMSSKKSSTFWDALGNFANILGSIAGATSAYNPYSSFGLDSNSSSSYSNTGGNSYNYQSEYNRWENLAKRHYNSLTNLGYRVKRNDGSRSGGTLSSMSGSNYVQMKKSLRDAQHEMQKIRRRAAQNGVTINQSTWETATVGY